MRARPEKLARLDIRRAAPKLDDRCRCGHFRIQHQEEQPHECAAFTCAGGCGCERFRRT